MDYFYKLDKLNSLYSKRKTENFDEMSLINNYPRFNEYTNLVDELEFEWDWITNHKKKVFDEFADISSRLQDKDQKYSKEMNFNQKGSFFTDSKMQHSENLLGLHKNNSVLRGQYKQILSYRNENFERLRRENPKSLYELDGMISNLKTGKFIDPLTISKYRVESDSADLKYIQNKARSHLLTKSG